MESVKSEWPLVVFTTLSPLCAGVWIVAGLLALFDAFPGAHAFTMGYAGAFLCVLLVAALACSTLHLGKPLKALRAFKRLGNSTVSNEVFVGTAFAVFACLYVLVAQSLVEAGDMWKIPLAFVAGFAGLFVLFQCLAYRMRTVSTWNSPSFAMEFAVIAVLGGVVVEGVMLCFAPSMAEDVRMGLVAVEAVCCVATIFLVHTQGSVVAKSSLARKNSHRFLEQWSHLGIARVLSVVVGSLLWAYGFLVVPAQPAWAIVGAVLIGAGIVVGRYSFYRFYHNVGLPRS